MRKLRIYDDVQWLPAHAETDTEFYGIVTDYIPNQFGGSFRVQWLNGEWGYYSRKELDYVLPLWQA